MRLVKSIPAMLIVASTGPLSAQVPETWNESAEWEMIGRTISLRSETSDRVYGSPEVQAELMRAGISDACQQAEKAIDGAVEEFSETYRELAIRGLRQRFTLAESYQNRFALGPNGGLASVLKRGLMRLDTELFDSVEARARGDVLRDLESLPAVEGDWRGRFSDWAFRPADGIVFRIACTLETDSNPDEHRQAFDGFYREQPSR
ncbi:MAG: hypothetical protein C0471_12810 [Erythrobacter sp.]|nr:hypothetical protein [Erythrobacter sp.]